MYGVSIYLTNAVPMTKNLLYLSISRNVNVHDAKSLVCRPVHDLCDTVNLFKCQKEKIARYSDPTHHPGTPRLDRVV